MVINLDNKGIRSIYKKYNFFYIDLWGVVHNGIKLNKNAINTLSKFHEMNKQYVLLTNAPRPNTTVKTFLKNLGMKNKMLKKVYTSGEAALIFLNKKYKNKKFFHIGPPRDFDLFLKFKKNYTKNLNDADFILCTGLFEKYEKNLNYYKKILKNYKKKRMICTNPDLIVDRGNKREYCAGSIAKVFTEIGGKVIYFGKPYPEVYNQSNIKKYKKILVIGDNLNTDIKGANNLKYDSLLISNGIHKKEINQKGIKKVIKSYKSKINFIQRELKW